MPLITPTYLNDTSSQLWQLAATDQGLLTTTAVGSGSPVFTGIFLNDITIVQTWRLFVGTDGLLRTTAVASQPSAPTFISVNSPNLKVWRVQVTDGLLMTSSCTPAPAIGSLYIPNYNNIAWTQPMGIGTTVFPQQNTGSFGYPVPGLTMQEPGQGLWTSGCGHWWNSATLFRDYDSCAGGSIAIMTCPLCSFVIRVYTPYEIIDEPIQHAILIP